MDIWTWNPLHSKEAREICEHMTPEEKGKFIKLTAVFALCGSLMGILLTSPLLKLIGILSGSPLFEYWTFNDALTTSDGIRLSLGVVLTFAFVFGARRLVRKTLCGTEWAQEQGHTAATLRIDIFDRRKQE